MRPLAPLDMSDHMSERAFKGSFYIYGPRREKTCLQGF